MIFKYFRLSFFCFLFAITGRVLFAQEWSSNLPIVIIETQGQIIEDEPKIIVRMGIINNPDEQRN